VQAHYTIDLLSMHSAVGLNTKCDHSYDTLDQTLKNAYLGNYAEKQENIELKIVLSAIKYNAFLAPPSTMSSINHCLWAADFLEIDTWIVCILEPVKSPETSVTERSCRKVVAMVSLPITSVRVAHPGAVKLLRTALKKQTDSTARNREIKMVLS
jgi:HD superfamily phosphohydrolase YqeK